MPLRVLLFEYLHADAEMYAVSSEGMRREGRAMLLALRSDLARIKGVSVDVACCETAVADLTTERSFSVIQLSQGGMSEVSSAISRHAGTHDVIVPIIPECDDTLPTVVSMLRADGHEVLAPNNRLIAICSDKWGTYQELSKLGIPTIPTFRAEDLTTDAIPDGDLYVIKLRNGAGCDGIRKLPRHQLEALHATNALDQTTVVQPFVNGESLSIGMIGRGDEQPPLILPLAKQRIQWADGHPRYLGGEILPVNHHVFEETSKRIASRIGEALDLRRGYVGVDLMHCAETNQLFVTEINPRFCSSYVGYRQATSANLGAYVLHLKSQEQISWSSDVCTFDS